MTIKDIFDKVAIANEVTNSLNTGKITGYIAVQIEIGWWPPETFDTYTSFSEWMQKVWSERMVNAVVSFDQYELGKVCEISVPDDGGNIIHETVRITLTDTF